MKAKKSLGQNFLKDLNILSKIVEQGKISEKDTVLEIGPGTGCLTELILKKNPNKLIVVEKDEKLSNLLSEKYKNKLEIINKDILDCYKDFRFKTPIKVFGNLPYNISTKILLSFIKINNLSRYFSKFIFIFQKEVADRIIADENTKNYGRLSIITDLKMKNMPIRLKLPPPSNSSVNEELYPGQPSPNGFPDTPPPKLAPNGYHPKYGKKADRYRRLDPVSAVMMRKVGTDDPKTNKQVSDAAKKPK